MPNCRAVAASASRAKRRRRACDQTENPLPEIALFDAASDAAPLAALHSACFATAWNAAAITALLATPGTFAFHGDDGFVLARTAGDEAEILTLAVAPAARGRGLGRA